MEVNMNEDVEIIDTLVKMKIRALKRVLECDEPKVKLRLMREIGKRLIEVSNDYKL